MKILLINHYAGSPQLGMEYRPYYLSREWVRMGHHVRIVAGSYSHVRARQPEVDDDGPTVETVSGIDYQWFPTPPYRGNGLGRVKNIWSFLSQVWRAADGLAHETQPDVVIASSTYPMDFWVAQRIARKARAKLVFEVHDLWPLSPIELSGMSPWHPFALLCGAAEKAAYRDSDVVISMLPKVHDHMASRGLDLNKLTIVPNGISPDDWQGEPVPLRDDVAQAIRTARKAGRAVVGYAGSMGLPNALDVLLDAAALMRGQGSAGPSQASLTPSGGGRLEGGGWGQATPVQIVMVGDGHERARLAQRVTDEQLANVTMLPPIPKGQIPSFLQAIDVAYIGWQRVPIYRFGIAPNKLMDYMMAGCAVLHSVEAGNDPVAEAGCGLTVPPDSPTAVADGLRHMAALPVQERQAMGERGRAFVQAHHTYPVLAQRFLDACKAAKKA